MKKFSVIKRSKEFKYKDCLEIAPGCTVDDPDPEIIRSFDTLIDAMIFIFGEGINISTSISKYKSNTGTMFVVTEYVIQEREYDLDGNDITDTINDFYTTQMNIYIKNENFNEVAIFHSYKDAENFINHDDRELRMEF